MDGCTRRHFFTRTAAGMAAFMNLMGETRPTHFAPKAKRVIYLFQSGGPSQIELFDYKPRLADFQNTDLPDSIRMGQRLTGMSASQSRFPLVPSRYKFARHVDTGALFI